MKNIKYLCKLPNGLFLQRGRFDFQGLKGMSCNHSLV